MKTLVERVQELMDVMHWDVEKVATTAGVSASAVYQWLGHGTKTIHSIGKIDAAIYLERASGFSALWLAKGLGPKMARETPVENAPLSLADALALLGKAIELAPTVEGRQGAVSMLSTYISNPSANLDLLPLIAKRLSGELPPTQGLDNREAA
ncbi:hypothetical protein ACSFBF_07035 [Variovorax sp. ZT5P49]|uniref:hypothetical protein n=1 Tax=Variovorax sp. ZT5P49 TaxID=3443733 RepID=UPI003F473F61